MRIKERDALCHLTTLLGLMGRQVHQDVSAPPGTVLWEAGQNWESTVLHVIALVFFSMFFRLSISKFCTSLENTQRERERERERDTNAEMILLFIDPISISYIARGDSQTTTSLTSLMSLTSPGPRNAQRAIVLYC